MPFAKKFRAMMDFPFAGDRVGDFIVESVDVRDVHGGAGGYAYDVRMVLRGPGGQAGVRRTLKAFFAQHPTTFSGYGNPYQLWFLKPEIESLGDKRYAVRVRGAGARVYLAQDLARFLDYLMERGALTDVLDEADRAALIERYLDEHKAEIKRRVGRYRSKLRREEASTSG
ncbi:MAG: hypothetical protein ACP5JG_07765 [Anaerolineae bacterium]